MSVDLILPLSMALAISAWTLVFAWYLHPLLARRAFEAAVEPLLLLHCFRYVGLMFLIPGVTASPLDARFAAPAAYGDLAAAGLAFISLGALRVNRPVALASVWVFNLWGFADLLNAVARGLKFTPDGALGATYWIPALVVPLLLVSHVYLFGRLLTEIRTARVATRRR